MTTNRLYKRLLLGKHGTMTDHRRIGKGTRRKPTRELNRVRRRRFNRWLDRHEMAE